MDAEQALGLTGVRAAYAIAPPGADALCERLDHLAPSWPIGAHGVALLESWTQADTRDWLRQSLRQLAGWKLQQIERTDALGWRCRPSVTPFFVAHWDSCAGQPATHSMLARLRARGVKLRDASSLGLPGRVRLSVQAPTAQQALIDAWRAASASGEAASARSGAEEKR